MACGTAAVAAIRALVAERCPELHGRADGLLAPWLDFQSDVTTANQRRGMPSPHLALGGRIGASDPWTRSVSVHAALAPTYFRAADDFLVANPNLVVGGFLAQRDATVQLFGLAARHGEREW